MPRLALLPARKTQTEKAMAMTIMITAKITPMTFPKGNVLWDPSAKTVPAMIKPALISQIMMIIVITMMTMAKMKLNKWKDVLTILGLPGDLLSTNTGPLGVLTKMGVDILTFVGG